MVLYRYGVQHRLSLVDFLKYKTAILIHNLTKPIVKKIHSDILSLFIVGCGHSGTTLVASKVGNSKDVFLYGKERHIFEPVHGYYTSHKEMEIFLTVTDQLHKKVFCCKSPKAVHSVPRARKIVSRAKFIFIVRNPLDNVSSLQSRFNDLDLSIERYCIDNTYLLRNYSEEDSLIVNYEDFVTKPQQELKRIFSFLGLPFDKSIVKTNKSEYGNVSDANGNMALRVKQITKPIKPRIGRYSENLNQKEAAYVLEKTRRIATSLGYSQDVMEKIMGKE